MEASSEYFKRVEILRMEDGEKQAKRDLRQLFKEELKKATDDSRERSKNENQEEFFYDDLNIRKRSYKDLIKIYAFHFRDEAIFTLIKADEKFEEAENLVKNNPKLNLNTPQVRAIILEAKMILINEMLKRKILTS